MRRQRAHVHAARDRRLELACDLQAVETEDQNVDCFTCAANGRDRGHDAGVRLDDELHPAGLTARAMPTPKTAYRPNLTLTPPLMRRGVPIVEGLVWTKYTLSNMFCIPKNACRLRPMLREMLKSATEYPGRPVVYPAVSYPASVKVAAGIKLAFRSSLYCRPSIWMPNATVATFGFE